MKIFKRIVRVMMLSLIGLCIGLIVYSINARTLVNNAMPMPFGYGYGVILSGSMEPALSVDDLVIVKKQQEYQIDDIVVYQKEDTLIVHRIVSISDEEIITKGDANNTSDTPIQLKDIKGKVIKCISSAGNIVNFFKQPVVILMILMLLVLILKFDSNKQEKESLELVEIKKEIERLKREMNGEPEK